MLEDLWIKTHSPIDAAKLHALGVMTFYWNSSEMGLFWIFCNVSKLSGRLARILVYDLQSPAIVERVKLILPEASIPTEAKDAVEHGLSVFDVCRVNRNQLTHFLPSGGKNGIEFWRNKGPSIKRDPVPNDLEDIRRVAHEIRIMNNYLASVGNHLSAIHYGNEPSPLPDKPPLPERLWKPPPPGPKAPKRPPPPSQA